MNEPIQPRRPAPPSGPPAPGAPPTEVLGAEEPPQGPWWRQGWGLALIALVALIVGLGGGLAIGKSSNSSTTTSATNPPVTHTTTDTVQHTQTVTSTHTATVKQEGAKEGEGGGETQSFSGSGSKNLGTVKVTGPSSMRWTSEGESFAITSTNGELLSSEGHKGTASLAAGSYSNFEVQSDSAWTLKITPAG